MKCVKCGKPISGKYTWKGEYYGKECWKQYALPQLLAEKAQKDAEDAEREFLQSQCIIEVLKSKNLSRISNQFKLSFIPSVISQFDEKGFLSPKQENLAIDMLSNNDFDKLYILEYRTGLIGIDYCKQMTGYTEEEIINFKKI